MIRIFALALLVTVTCTSGPAAAALLGTQVNGTIRFGDRPENFYSPQFGFVPAGFGNSAGQPVTIAEPIIEFGFEEPGVNRDTANFTDTQLIIRNLSFIGAFRWVQTFTSQTSGAFKGISLVSSTFSPGLNFGLVGDTITVSYAGSRTPFDSTAVFNISTSVPEPATWAMMIAGFGMAGAAMRRRSTTARIYA